MTEQEFTKHQVDGNVSSLPQQASPPEASQTTNDPDPLAPDFASYLAVLEALKRPKRHLTAAPTFKPKNLFEQIQFYENGTTRRVYFYINGSWRYATLT